MINAGATGPETAPEPIRDPVLVADGFLPIEQAEAIRHDIDAHFANPHAHRPETHQVWNYWFVPELYTYLRTSPEKVIRGDLIEAFMRHLQWWSLATLGMGKITWPFLSLYVDGCRQGWHNDAGNGRFGFVYSLTRDERQTTGGETLVMRQGDLLRSNLSRPTAGSGLYESVAPRFNRLVVFDDRMPHAVERVAGAMDPVQGRFVLHGHLSEAGAAVAGALPIATVTSLIDGAIRAFVAEASARVTLYHGPLSLRLIIDPKGTVTTCDILLDRVLHPDAGDVAWEPLRARLIARIVALRFPAAESESIVIQPIMFGGPLASQR